MATNVGGSANSNAATLTVNRNAQSVNFSGGSITINSPVTLSPSATSGLTAFTFLVTGTPTASYTLVGNSLTLTSAGSVTVQATQPGNNYYVSAANSATFTASGNVAPSIDTHPSNQTVTAGQNATFTVAASGSPAPAYQWQLSTDGGAIWNNLSNDATYSGVTTTTLTVTGTIVGQNGYRYRAIASNIAGSATTNHAVLTVNAANVAPSIDTHPSNQTVTAGQNATFTVAASGTPAPTFQWQLSTDGGTVWNNLANDSSYSGVTTVTLTVIAPGIGQNGYRYRAVATNIAGSANSNGALLTVNAANVAPTIDTHPSNQTVTAGQNATFTVAASGTPAPTFQWQLSTDGGTIWGDLANDSTYSGVTTVTLTVTGALIGQNGYRYRAVATNVAGFANSNSALLTVNAANVAPSIDTHPTNQIVTAGQNATFTVAASGTPAPTFQWQLSTDGGTIWNNLANDSTYSGVTTVTLTVTSAQLGQNGYRYRAVATNVAGSANSNGATLTVQAATLTVLHHFNIFTGAGNPSVSESLTLVGNNLYGTTYGGGTNFKGTVFSINKDGGTLNILHSFSALDVNNVNGDGQLPVSTLTYVNNKLYGTATSGGTLGNGVLYSINPDGTGFTPIYNFSGSDPLSSYAKHSPIGQMTLVGSTLYGVTNLGGNPTYDGSVNGRIFAHTLGGGVTIPYAFPDVIWDGDHLYTPYGPGRGLVYLNGKIYGTTVSGGYDNHGTVFSVNANGSGYTTLHLFVDTDGAVPLAGMILAGDTLYGTTNSGGASNRGVIFSIKTDGSAFTVLHHFSDPQGFNAEPGMLIVGDTLYGSTAYGGGFGYGALYSLKTNGTNYTVLHSFNRFVDGSFPTRLIRSRDVLYGMTSSGGTSDYGTIFRYSLGFDADFATWQQGYFTAAELGNSSISGPNAVYGSDGLPNLVKFALGLDPKVNATTNLPAPAVVGSDWVYTYTRPSSITDVTYAVEVSTNLTTWTTSGVTHEFVSASGGIDTWRARFPTASATSCYFRLKVTRP